MIIEDDGQEQKKPAPAAVPPHPAFNLSPGGFGAAAAAPSGSPFAVPGAAVLDEGVYQAVLKKTNFDDTPVGKTIHKYYDALEGVIADQTQRFKAAIGQAQKLDGVTPDQVLLTFDAMETALETDARGFQGVADKVEQGEIVSRQNKIAELQQQVTNLNQQIVRLQTELVDQQTTHANAVQQYGLAQQRRATEIAQQKAQFAALLSH
jgi:hypothetical protein